MHQKIILLLKLLKNNPRNFLLYVSQSIFKNQIRIYFDGDWLNYNLDGSTLYHLVYSLPKLKKMVECLPSKVDGIIIDGGANNGIFSHLASKKFNNKIYAFEPSEILADIIKKNKKGRDIEIIRKAISNSSDTIDFYVDKDSDQIGSTKFENVANFSKNKSNINTLHVQSITLEDFQKELEANNIGILKLDIQGGEYEALKANEKILETVDILILECMLIEETIFDLLKLVRKYYNRHLTVNQVAFGADVIFYKDHIKITH